MPANPGYTVDLTTGRMVAVAAGTMPTLAFWMPNRMSNRLRMVRVNFETFALLFEKADDPRWWYRIIEGLPLGAKFEGGYFDIGMRCAKLFFTHATFDEIGDGDQAPELTVQMMRERVPVDWLAADTAYRPRRPAGSDDEAIVRDGG